MARGTNDRRLHVAMMQEMSGVGSIRDFDPFDELEAA